MALSWFEKNFPFQIYVPCRKESLVKIRIQGTDGHIQFRMVCQDMIGRLSLFDQWGNDLILFVKLPFSHVDPCSGIPEFFPVFPVSEDRKSTRLNSSHVSSSYPVSCLRKKSY